MHMEMVKVLQTSWSLWLRHGFSVFMRHRPSILVKVTRKPLWKNKEKISYHLAIGEETFPPRIQHWDTRNPLMLTFSFRKGRSKEELMWKIRSMSHQTSGNQWLVDISFSNNGRVMNGTQRSWSWEYRHGCPFLEDLQRLDCIIFRSTSFKSNETELR